MPGPSRQHLPAGGRRRERNCKVCGMELGFRDWVVRIFKLTGEGGSPRDEEDVEPDPEEVWEQSRGGANAENDVYVFETQEMANMRRQKWEQAAQRKKLLVSRP